MVVYKTQQDVSKISPYKRSSSKYQTTQEPKPTYKTVIVKPDNIKQLESQGYIVEETASGYIVYTEKTFKSKAIRGKPDKYSTYRPYEASYDKAGNILRETFKETYKRRKTDTYTKYSATTVKTKSYNYETGAIRIKERDKRATIDTSKEAVIKASKQKLQEQVIQTGKTVAQTLSQKQAEYKIQKQAQQTAKTTYQTLTQKQAQQKFEKQVQQYATQKAEQQQQYLLAKQKTYKESKEIPITSKPKSRIDVETGKTSMFYLSEFIETQKTKQAKGEFASPLLLSAQIIQTSGKVAREVGKQTAEFVISGVKGLGKVSTINPTTGGFAILESLTPPKVSALTSPLQSQSKEFQTAVKKEQVKVEKLAKDKDVQTFGTIVGIGALSFASPVLLGVAEVGFAGYTATEFIKQPSVQTGATAILGVIPTISRTVKVPKTYESPLKQLKRAEIEKTTAKEIYTEEPFISTTKERFIPFQQVAEVTSKGVEPVIETIKVTEKPPGFDIPTKFKTDKGEFIVTPLGEQVIKPKTRQLQLIKKTYEPFEAIYKQEAQSVQVRLPTEEELFAYKLSQDIRTGKQKQLFDYGAELDLQLLSESTFAKIGKELKQPKPQEPINFGKVKEDIISFKQTEFKQPTGEELVLGEYPKTTLKAEQYTPQTIKLPFVKRRGGTLFASKRGALEFGTTEFELPETFGRVIIKIEKGIKSLPERISTPIKDISISKTRVSPILGIKPISGIKPLTGIKPISTIKPISGIKPISDITPKLDVIPKFDVVPKIKQTPKIDITTDIGGITDLVPSFKTSTTSIAPLKITPFKSITKITEEPSRKISRIKLPKFVEQPKQQKQVKGYDSYAYKNGKRIKLNTAPQSKHNAFATVSMDLDKSRSYKGYIKPSGKKIIKQPSNPYFTQNKYKFVKKNNKLTEKKKYRKDSPFEF